MKPIEFSKQQIIDAISNNPTMGAAAKNLKVDWRTFKQIAEKYDLYHPVRIKRPKKYPLEEIFAGLYPQYPTSKLNYRLISEGYKPYKCELCGITEWQNKKISLELNHIDGDNSNHKLDNLQLICPNCHSQTSTYRSKNIQRK